MSSVSPTTVKFLVKWKVSWSEYSSITSSTWIEKKFVTSHNNISLHWGSFIRQIPETDPSKNSFYLYYLDGPLEKFSGMEYTIAIVKPDQTMVGDKTAYDYVATRSADWGWRNFHDRNSVALREKYGLEESDPLIYRIVLRVPVSAFSYKIENLLPTTTPPQWQLDLLNVIDDPEKSVHSNAKLISRDGHSFYCHKVISFQSAALDAMFRHPPGENQVENEYEFPNLGKDSLKSLIQFLYTGQATLGDLSTADLIDLADGAEQYDLKPLKQACASVLWDRVVEEPSMCYKVVRFAHLHDDMKYLKYRAMDVLAENSEIVDSSGSVKVTKETSWLMKFFCLRFVVSDRFEQFKDRTRFVMARASNMRLIFT